MSESDRSGLPAAVHALRFFQWFSFSAKSLNAKRAMPAATIRATQLTDFGTDQPAIRTGQSIKIRSAWTSATNPKIIPVTRKYVFQLMRHTLKIFGAAVPTSEAGVEGVGEVTLDDRSGRAEQMPRSWIASAAIVPAGE